MDRLTLRLSADLVRRFDAAAAGRGGRSRFLRRLMEEAAQAPLPETEPGAPAPRSGKLTLRLSEDDLALLEVEAGRAGLSRTQWSVALIRYRLHRRLQRTPPQALVLIEIHRELHRIGVNVNQIARALNTAVMEGQVLDLETAQLAVFAAEIRGLIADLRALLSGDQAYWATEP